MHDCMLQQDLMKRIEQSMVGLTSYNEIGLNLFIQIFDISPRLGFLGRTGGGVRFC